MIVDGQGLGMCRVAGTPRDIGRAIGAAGRAAVHRDLVPSDFWQQMTAERHRARVDRMRQHTQAAFPDIWQEILGLAEGLDLPVEQVMAWNCRGDLLASAPDGCTTVLLPGDPMIVAHNEDGLPFFRGACFIAEVRPVAGPRFWSFCYPGSIPGHTFACSGTGLVQTVNNIRLTGVEADYPRMVLGRAVLAARTVADATGLLRAHSNSGGFHFALAQAGADNIHSVEFGGGEVHVRMIGAPSVHANHALHLPKGSTAQIVTASSRDRQMRGEGLLEQGERDALRILADKGGPGLPIRRDAPDDPDDENTMATALFRIGRDRTSWQVYGPSDTSPAFQGSSDSW